MRKSGFFCPQITVLLVFYMGSTVCLFTFLSFFFGGGGGGVLKGVWPVYLCEKMDVIIIDGSIQKYIFAIYYQVFK